jgi:hypothetical protein
MPLLPVLTMYPMVCFREYTLTRIWRTPPTMDITSPWHPVKAIAYYVCTEFDLPFFVF